jgi:two-component system, NarL family, sensor histidine kinase UhpB
MSSAQTGWPLDPFERAKDDVFLIAQEGVVMVDECLRILMINPAALHMFACVAADVMGHQLTRFIPALREHVESTLQADHGEPMATPLPDCDRAPMFGQRLCGQTFPLDITVCGHRIGQGAGAHAYTTVLLHDVSRELALKAQLDGFKNSMRAIFDLAPVATWITEGEVIVYANQACAGLFGASDCQALVGQSIYALLKSESHASVRQKMAQVLSSGGCIPTLNERIARLDGSVRDVIISVAALPDHGQTTAQMVIQDMTERTLESQRLERSRRALQRMSANLVAAREEERRRIARELHDELGQRLTALKMELASLAPLSGQAARSARITDMLHMVDETVASVRRIATELRPMMLDDLGVNAAIESLAREFERRMGIQITLALDEAAQDAGDAVATALYRMVQEALTNIARHARATQAWIDIHLEAGELRLSVRDNGVGLSKKFMYRDGSHGLVGILERAHMLGGDMEVGTNIGGGGFIAVRLPMDGCDQIADVGDTAHTLGATAFHIKP